jgi:hypothetical protein
MRRLTLVFIVLSLLAPAAVQATELPPRPRMEDYRDQTAFVADVLAWQQLRDKLAHSVTTGAETGQIQVDPHDWHHVTGPENLETAVQNAEGYVQPNYREKLRFNRTTHLSFPLQQLPPTIMSAEVATSTTVPTDTPASTELELLPVQMMEQLEQMQRLTAQTRSPGLASSISATP